MIFEHGEDNHVYVKWVIIYLPFWMCSKFFNAIRYKQAYEENKPWTTVGPVDISPLDFVISQLSTLQNAVMKWGQTYCNLEAAASADGFGKWSPLLSATDAEKWQAHFTYLRQLKDSGLEYIRGHNLSLQQLFEKHGH